MKPSNAKNDNLIDQTRQIWQPRLGRDLTRDEARQIAENVTGFFEILAEWSQAERSSAGNDSAEPYQAATGRGVRHAR